MIIMQKSHLIIFFAALLLSHITYAKIPSATTDRNTSYLQEGENYKIVWNIKEYNAEFKTTVFRLNIDKALLAKAPRYLIALLALPGYQYGNECNWDGNATAKRENLKCTLNDALGVGYQCSDTQIKLLKQYFPEMKEVEIGCSTQPEGSTIGTILTQVDIKQTSQNIFELGTRFVIYNTREDLSKSTIHKQIFKFSNGHFTLIKEYTTH